MKKSMLIIALASITMVGGCTKKASSDLPPPPADQDGGGYSSGDGKPAPGSQADFIASIESDHIYFDTDKYNIDADDQRILQSQAQWLVRYPQKQIVVEGHCDERGTRDYNLALGERRANAAKNYLAAIGVDPSRISVVSYGKERPVALGSDESAWAQNRRAVTITVE